MQTDKDMKEIIKTALTRAEEFVMNGDQAELVFLVEDREGKKSVVMAPSESRESDTHMLTYLRVLFAILGVQAYCLVSEVWVSERETREGPMPSEDPNRKEAILALAVRRVVGESGEPMLVTRTARRTITRNPTAVGPIDWYEAVEVTGRFASLIPVVDHEPCPDVPFALKKLQEMGETLGFGVLDMEEERRKGAH